MLLKKTIALVEPCYYGLGYIDAAYSRGYDIISIVSSMENPAIYGYEDKYKNLIIADIRDPKSIINALKPSNLLDKIDAIIPATDYATHITSEVAEYFGFTAQPYMAALRARRKDLAREVYEENGVPNPKFATVNNLECSREIIERVGYPMVLKPTDGACSQNVILVKNDDEFEKAAKLLLGFEETYLGFKPRKEFLIEEFIPGEEFSIEIFIYNGKIEFAAVTEKISGQLPYFAEVGHVVPASTHKDKISDIIEVAHKAILSLGFINGPFHAEARLSPRGPIIMEVNGRPGGDNIATELLVNAFGVNFFDASINTYLKMPVQIKPAKNLASSIAYLAASREGNVKSIDGADKLMEQKNVVKSRINVKAGDSVRPPQDSDDRYGYVITVASTSEEAKNSALNAIGTVNLHLDA